jgi:phosphoglycolate phosphatase-like HAD superfamily hydrolase
VALVHDQLETFKYVGDLVRDKKGKLVESGEGLPISIVTLPDFVLDFNLDCIAAGPFAVGGHAGQITCALMHLLSDEDATHRVHFLTRTAALATRLLEDEFSTGKPENSVNTYRRYCEPLIQVRGGQPRGAFGKGQDIDSGAPEETLEINADDHIKGLPLATESIAGARAVYIGSFNTPGYANIFNAVWERMPQGCWLFQDTRRADYHPKTIEPMLQAIMDRSDGERQVVLFVRGSECEALYDPAERVFGISSPTLQTIAQELKARVLHYTRDSIHLYSGYKGDACGELLARLAPDCTEIYPSARFRAGVILAAAARAALDSLPGVTELRKASVVRGWGQGLYNLFETRWASLGGKWEAFALYGAALASISANGNRFSLRDDVLRTYGSPSADPLDIQLETVNESARVSLDDPNIAAFAQLGTRRRHGKLGDPHLPRCTANSCHDQCVFIESKQKVAVMIDLDGTLMDATVQRGRALEKALAEIHKGRDILPEAFARKHTETKERVAFFEENVYKRHDAFAGLRLGDFRQEWNHHGWYAAYIVLARSFASKDGAMNGALPAGFAREYEAALRDHGVEIDRAIAAFSEVQLHPFKEARDLLASLEAAGVFNLYVVSEGHPETQWKKLRSIGLDDYFKRSHVLTTGDAAPEYDKERQQFLREMRDLERRREDVEREMKYAERAGSALTEIERTIVRWSANSMGADGILDLVEGIERERRRPQWEYERALTQAKAEIQHQVEAATCVEKILARLREKLSLSFYAAVLRAIMRSPDRPLDILHDLQKIRSGRSTKTDPLRMKFAMIGDRQTKDIHAPLELLTDARTSARHGIVAIRLLSRGYAAHDRDNPDHPDRNYSPDYFALTLSHAKAILLSRGTWRPVDCLEREPALFNWGVSREDPQRIPKDPADNGESIGINHLIAGMSMPRPEFPVISSICAAFLTEYTERCSRDERNAILDLLFDDRDEPAKRAARISAFTIAEALKSMPDVEVRFAQELVKCRNEAPTRMEQVLIALVWIKDNASSERAKEIAKDAVQ